MERRGDLEMANLLCKEDVYEDERGVPESRLEKINMQQCSTTWTFILYLALNERLQTRETLAAWGIVDDSRCVLCSSGMDSSEHLFFVCGYSATLWRKILHWMHIDNQVLGWKEEITWALRHFKGKHALAEIFLMA